MRQIFFLFLAAEERSKPQFQAPLELIEQGKYGTTLEKLTQLRSRGNSLFRRSVKFHLKEEGAQDYKTVENF